MSSFLDSNVLITGGAGGLGQQLALAALREGAHRVVLWDIDEEGLSIVAQQFEAYQSRIITQIVDLTNSDQIYSSTENVLTQLGSVDILINNAGIVVGKLFHEYTADQIKQVIDLNVSGVMHTTRAFLPTMLDQGRGHIVTISSAASLVGNPRMAVYAGSKWAVTGWSESLRLEMEAADSDIKVTTVQPSYINTGMFEGVTTPMFTPLLETEEIAKKIVDVIKREKSVLREPFIVKLIPFLKGILPAPIFDLVAGKLFRVYKSMDTFKGGPSND